MNIDFQKLFYRVTPLLCCFVLLLGLFPVSASAAPIDYNDFVTDVQVDGDNDLVTFILPLKYSSIQVARGSTSLGHSIGTGRYYKELEGSSSINYEASFFSIFASRLKVTNIPNGTTFKFSYCVSVLPDTSYITTPVATLIVRYYDASGTYLGLQNKLVGNITLGETFTS